MGAKWNDPMFTTVFFTNTLLSAPGTEQGARRHNRGFLRGGLAAAGLSHFLFLSLRSGRRLRRWVHCPWRFGGWRLAEREQRDSGLAAGWTAGGTAFADCAQGQVGRTAQLVESCGIRVRLIHGAEEFCLEHLQDRHGVKRRGRLSSRWIGSSSESWSRPTGFGWVGGFCLPANGHGRAEMCSHWLIQGRQAVVSFSSAPSTEVRAEEEEARRRDE